MGHSSITSNDSDGTIILHLKNGGQSIPDGLVTSAINAILNVLGIDKDKMKPGRGLIIDNVKSILYAAPVVLHYIRYFIF